jgi:hypothetical protein
MVYLTSTGVAASTANLFISTSNNVGIGNTTPPVKLWVPATSTTTGIGVYNGDVATIIGTAAGGTNAGSIQVKSSGSSSAIGATNYTLALNPDGGFVGVGTTSPADLLEVKGSITIANVATTQTFINMRQGLSSTYNCSISTYSHNGDGFYDGLSLNGYDGVSICTGSNTRQERVRIDSAGKVGIGTTTPTRPLVVNRIAGGGANNPAIMIGNNGIAGGLRFQTYDLAQQADAYMGLGTDMGGFSFEHSLVFSAPTTPGYTGRQTIGSYDGTTYSTKMTILQSGIVQIPGQPAFSAYRNAGDVGANTVFICNVVQVNIGSCYNLSNGRFTAPVAGTYLFAFHCMATGSPTTFTNIAIRKNGTFISFGHGDTGAYNHTNAQVITTMAANDYVDAFVVGGYTAIYGGGGEYNNFNGHLIG